MTSRVVTCGFKQGKIAPVWKRALPRHPLDELGMRRDNRVRVPPDRIACKQRRRCLADRAGPYLQANRLDPPVGRKG